MKYQLQLTLAALLAAAPGATFAADDGWQTRVGEALGKPGAQTPSGVYRVGFPRTDLKVTLDGVELKPGFALGGWLAFAKMGEQGMVMGDLVLTEAEVNPVMTKLAAGGVEVTALHNHLLRNQPFTMYMHVLGHGDPVKLAAALHTALAESKTPLSATAPAAPAATPPPIDLDTAAITGDFVLIAKEVNPVAKALREHGIEVTALHNHMLDDQPRLFFMHFWANDDANKLAQGLKAALDKINVKHG